jgi:hypothetical protein
MTRDTAKQMIKSLSSMEDWADGFCFGSTPSTSQLSFSPGTTNLFSFLLILNQ